MVRSHVLATSGLGAFCVALAPFAATTPASAAPATPSCAALHTMDEQLDDMHFDLDNLRIVLNNVYASPDVKKHDEDFRIKMLINVVGRIKDAANQSGDAAAKQGAADVDAGFQDLKAAIEGQFIVNNDDHYDFYSSTHYQSPRLSGGTPASPEAYGAIDSLDGQRQDLADVVDDLNARQGCPEPNDDGTLPGEDPPQCRFHPGSNQCDATGSILH